MINVNSAISMHNEKGASGILLERSAGKMNGQGHSGAKTPDVGVLQKP